MSASSTEPVPASVVVAYSYADRISARLICESIRRLEAVRVWFDEDEFLPGSDHRQQAIRALNEADAVVLCVSARTRQPDYVESMLDEAGKEAGRKPLIIVARLESFPLPDELRTWLTIDWFEPDANDQLLRVIRALRSAPTCKPGIKPVVRQLPECSELYGRAEDLAELRALVADGATIINLYGQPGVGKSALAAQLCRDLSDNFPEAQLYLSGSGDVELTSSRALAHVASSLDVMPVGGSAPGGEAPLTDGVVLRDSVLLRLSRGRILMLMDNLESPIALAPLVPVRPGNLLVITSRSRLDLPGAEPYLVAQLNSAASTEMLSHLSGRPPEALRRLARECAFNPLKLQMAGCALAAAHELTVDECLRTLASSGENPSAISLAQLDAAPRDRWQALTWLPASFSVEGAAAIWGDSEKNAECTLNDFVARALLQKHGEPGRFLVHDALKEASRQVQDKGTSRQRALCRYAEFLADFAERAENALRSPLRTSEHWMERLDGEEASYEWLLAPGHADQNNSIAATRKQAACRAAGALFWYWNLKGRFSHGRNYLQACIAALPAGTPEPVRARLFYAYAGLSFMLSEFDTAIRFANQSARLWTKAGSLRHAAYAIVVRGMSELEIPYRTAEQRAQAGKRAARILRPAVDHFKKAEDNWGSALALTDLGRAVGRYSYRQAEEMFRESLQLWNSQNDTWGQALALNAWGTAAKSDQRYDVAGALLRQSAELQKELGDHWGLASSLLELGGIYVARGEIAPALPAYRTSLELHTRLGRKELISRCLNAISGLAALFGDIEWTKTLESAAIDLDILAINSPVITEDPHVVEEALAWLHKQEQILTSVKRSRSGRRFLVGLSFPGEVRTRVEAIAVMLGYRLGQSLVLYDRWYQDEFARAALDSYLQSLYRDHTDLLAVFLCPEYARKNWCGIEWETIRGVIHDKGTDRVMLLLLEECDVDGLDWSRDGFLDIRGKSELEVAAAIARRLRLLT